jgi:hypothetical protein
MTRTAFRKSRCYAVISTGAMRSITLSVISTGAMRSIAQRRNLFLRHTGFFA